MLQHTDKNQFIMVGKARDVKLALASIKKHSEHNQTLQQYLKQRPTMSIKLHID